MIKCVSPTGGNHVWGKGALGETAVSPVFDLATALSMGAYGGQADVQGSICVLIRRLVPVMLCA